MKLLIDTHLLLWAGSYPDRVPEEAKGLIEDEENQSYFSSASIWEIAIKYASRNGFETDPRLFRRDLLANDYNELFISSEHAINVANLPPVHKDPFDRILIAQAIVEGMILLTSDMMVARYPGPIRKV